MDDAVLAALAKWPNVPACHGWLQLDARGQWRLGAPEANGAEIVRHRGLAAFLGRNYAHTDDGAWYCQNGPQRAYVDLECAPWSLRLDGASAARPMLRTHNGRTVEQVHAAYLADDGRLYLATEHGLGVVDDRDLDAMLPFIGSTAPYADREALLGVSAAAGAMPSNSGLQLHWHGADLPLQRIAAAALPARYGYRLQPRPTNPDSPDQR